jgi:hypothetical protein
MISFACPTLFGNVSAQAFRKLYSVPIMRGREDDATPDARRLADERSRKVRLVCEHVVTLMLCSWVRSLRCVCCDALPTCSTTTSHRALRWCCSASSHPSKQCCIRCACVDAPARACVCVFDTCSRLSTRIALCTIEAIVESSQRQSDEFRAWCAGGVLLVCVRVTMAQNTFRI